MRSVLTKLLIISSFFMVSCEYHHHSRIINESGDDIEVLVHFDRRTFEKAWGKESYFPFLRTYNHEPPKIILLDFDSVNLVSRYRIENNSFFSIGHGVGGKIIVPTYEGFKSIKVITITDSMEIRTPPEFKSKFKPDGRNDFEWIIK